MACLLFLAKRESPQNKKISCDCNRVHRVAAPSNRLSGKASCSSVAELSCNDNSTHVLSTTHQQLPPIAQYQGNAWPQVVSLRWTACPPPEIVWLDCYAMCADVQSLVVFNISQDLPLPEKVNMQCVPCWKHLVLMFLMIRYNTQWTPWQFKQLKSLIFMFN